MVSEYKISQETAHSLAVGLFQQVGTYIKKAIEDNPEEYENFKTDYLAKQKLQTSAHKDRRKAKRKTPPVISEFK